MEARAKHTLWWIILKDDERSFVTDDVGSIGLVPASMVQEVVQLFAVPIDAATTAEFCAVYDGRSFQLFLTAEEARRLAGDRTAFVAVQMVRAEHLGIYTKEYVYQPFFRALVDGSSWIEGAFSEPLFPGLLEVKDVRPKDH